MYRFYERIYWHLSKDANLLHNNAYQKASLKRWIDNFVFLAHLNISQTISL